MKHKKTMSEIWSERRHDELTELKNRLYGATLATLNRHYAILVYLDDSPDKKRAEEDLQDAKYSLRAAIAVYDDFLNECRQRGDTWVGHFNESHVVIECAVANYHQGRGH